MDEIRAHLAMAAEEKMADGVDRQAARRTPELVPIRYGRMAASPFAFFRGSALQMALDLAAKHAALAKYIAFDEPVLVNLGDTTYQIDPEEAEKS